MKTGRDIVSNNFPLFVFCGYFVFSYILFLIAPFNWQIDNIEIVSLYVLCVFIVLIMGFGFSAQKRVIPCIKIPVQKYIIAGAILSVFLLFPTMQLYSGKFPWQVLDLLSDQNKAYLTYQERLRNSTQLDRAPVAVFRTIIYPITFAVLPLAILHWKSISWTTRILAMITLLCIIFTSLARGTDRETFDIAIIFGACSLIIIFRRRTYAILILGVFRNILNRKTLLILSALLIIGTVVFQIFIERKIGRYGDHYKNFCIGSELTVCLDKDAEIITNLGDKAAFTIGITAAYLSQGYYGMSLAMKQDFQSTYGTGSSFLVARLYEAVTGDAEMYKRSYSYRLREFGWSDKYAWTTFMTWLANDVSYPGALILLLFMFYMFGAAWRDAVFASNDRAAIVFCLLFTQMVYLPANNQIGQTLDLTFTLLFWIFMWQKVKILAIK